MMCPIEWTHTYAATIHDHPSFRYIRRMITHDLERDARLRSDIVRANGEEFAVAEWDRVMGDLKAQREEALAILDARIEELGVQL